ncbi:MAG: 2OG-Fe(II) oxygenase [Myxococcales bacterium]|nr:2OG-Fe(II) oxygenase [Myxococcales bacterium]
MSRGQHDDAIARAILGISSPYLATGEVLLREPVRVRFKDGRAVPVGPSVDCDAQALDNAELTRVARPAKVGKGRSTVLDRNVRDGAQIAASEFTLEGVDLPSSGILEQLREALSPDDATPFTAEPYALHIYGANGYFDTHKDTPTDRTMVGSLVLCLPSRFTGGELSLSHNGLFDQVDWASEIEASSSPLILRWAAFFSDVDHRVEPVYAGSRVTMTYRLSRPTSASPAKLLSTSAREAPLVRALKQALADGDWEPDGARLAVPCVHMYSTSAEGSRKSQKLTATELATLKGRDAVVARAAMKAGLSVSLRAVVFTEADEEALWELPEVPSRVRIPSRATPDDVLDALPEGSTSESDLAFLLRGPPDASGGDADTHASNRVKVNSLGEREFSFTGYFGNEGSFGEFYLFAVLVIEVPPAKRRS